MPNHGRDEFERVISRPPYMCSVRRMDDTAGAEYIATDVQLAWEMFQIGRSQAQRELYSGIADVMQLLEQIPQGNVGLCGPTLAEIEAVESVGDSVANDACYHTVQKAWLLLDAI